MMRIPPEILEGFSDADWAGDPDTRCSTSGYMFLLGGGAISWGSKTQTSPALSSTEVEYVRATCATQEALWLRQMLFDLGIHQSDPTRVWCDNQSSITLSSNPSSYAHTKHIAIRHHFVHDTIARSLIQLSWIPSEKQVADILTKDLGRTKHEHFCLSMGLVSRLRGGVERK